MTITYREGSIVDSQSVFQVFVKAIMDYSERMGVMAITGGNDPQVLESLWQKRRTMLEFLAKTAAQFWVDANPPYYAELAQRHRTSLVEVPAP